LHLLTLLLLLLLGLLLLHALGNHLPVGTLLPLLCTRLPLEPLLSRSHHLLRSHLAGERLAWVCTRRPHAVHLSLSGGHVTIDAVEKVRCHLRVAVVAHEVHR
jgi:hypothetical protein